VPIIDKRPKRGQKTEAELELKSKRNANYKTAQMIRYNHRSSVERLNGRLKDEFNARMVRVKGHAKVMSHLHVWNHCFNCWSINEIFSMIKKHLNSYHFLYQNHTECTVVVSTT